MERGRDLQVALCRLQYDGRYTLTNFGGEYEDLDKAAQLLRETEAKFEAADRRVRRKGENR